MSLIYRILYRVGFTPWDTDKVPSELRELVEGEAALPPGRALDIGCGTGTQSVYIASHGWKVTGVDNVEQPLKRARARSAAVAVAVNWVKADVTRLDAAGLDPGYTLLLDRGCFHGLSDEERAGYVRGVSGLAAPGAVLEMMCFGHNRVPVGPRGVDRGEIERRFGADWELESDAADSGPGPAGPLGNVPRTWYRLRRR
jgi:SAM-dependent methyltransferase